MGSEWVSRQDIYKQHKFVAGVDSECVKWQDVCLKEGKKM